MMTKGEDEDNTMTSPRVASAGGGVGVALCGLLRPLPLDVLVVRVVGVLLALGLDSAHQHGHDDEGEHADHHGQVPLHIQEVLLQQGLVQRIGRRGGVPPPGVQVPAQGPGQGVLQAERPVGPGGHSALWGRGTGRQVGLCAPHTPAHVQEELQPWLHK